MTDNLTDKAALEEIAMLEGVIKGLANRKRVTMTDMANPQMYERRRAELVQAIATVQRQLDDLDDRHLNGHAIIDDCDRQIAECRERLLLLKNRAEVARIKKLAEQIKALTDEFGEDAVRELLAANSIESIT